MPSITQFPRDRRLDTVGRADEPEVPIPIRAAPSVGEILKYVTDETISSDCARYI
jgi:hypothetical protein